MDSRVEKYFIELDNNCAEAVLRILNESHQLGISEENIKLVSAFGGGCGCGKLCGALAGALAALGYTTVEGRAHITPGFKENCAALCAAFEKSMGSCDCAQVKPVHFQEGIRCAKVVEAAVAVYEGRE